MNELFEELADASRILANEGVLDAFGHVSVRHPERNDRFLIASGLAPATVTPSDIVELDLDGETVDGSGRQSYNERFIHGEIYRMRSDVRSVVHSHTSSIVPFSVVATPLRAIAHVSAFVGTAVPVFEIRETSGPATNLLVSTSKLGRALTRVLGSQSVVLMRGHGMVVVGPSIKHAVYRAIYAELNARLQVEAMHLGEVTYLNEGEIRACAQMQDTVVDRPWKLWKERLR